MKRMKTRYKLTTCQTWHGFKTSRLCIVSFLTLFLFSALANAQLVTEDFNYTASSALVVTNGYTANSGTGTNNLTIAASGTGLSYAGSPRSNVGLALPMANTGEDAYKSFTAQTAGAVYASALINISAASATGDYFFSLMTGATYNVRVFVKSSGAGYVVGLSKAGATAVYDATVRTFGVTQLIVIKYEFVTGTLNDPVSLFLNPTLGGTEPTALLTSIGAPTADAASISSYGFRQGGAASSPTLVIDGIMVGTTWAQVTPAAAATPTISQPTAITGLNYTGAGPSAWTSYTFTGSNLSPASGNITVAGTTNFEVSSDGITAAAGNSYTVAYSGSALASTTTYVRLKAGLSPATYGPVSGVTLTGGGATTINVSTTGVVTSPTLTPSVASITGLNYTGTGPSSPQSFTFSGANLSGSGNITATAPTNFEVSTDGVSYFPSVVYPHSPGTLTAQTVYVRLKTSLPATTYGPSNITIAGGGATTANVAVSGTVTSAAAPTLTPSVASITGLDYSGTGPSSAQSFTFSGTNLTGTGNINVTAPTNFEVSTDGVSYFGSVTYPHSPGTLTAQTVYVRLNASLAAANYGPSNISIAGGGATTLNIAVSGIVSINPYLTIPAINSAVLSDFNSIGNTATATLSSGFRIGTDWSTGVSATTLAYGTSGTGAVTGTSGGGIINWANGVTASSTDRAIGSLTTGTFTSPRSIILAIQNNTGATATDLFVTYDIEKYRSGTRAWDVTFFHGSTATAATAATAGDQNYPADGANAVVNPPTSISKSVSLSGLSIPAGGIYYLRWTSTGLGGSTNSQGLGFDNIAVTLSNASSPSVTVTPTTLTGFTYTLGSGPSVPQTFTVSGTNLTNNVIITPPTNYEVSLTSGSGYVTSPSTLSVTQSGGSLTGQPVTIYTRLKSGLATGTYNGEIINVSSTGSISKTVSASGVVAAAIVSVSASTATSSEQAGTVVTITATSNNAVLTDQTVDVTVTGTGITGTDYSITDGDAAAGIQIKILAGNTTGTVTFTILDDNLLEATETATLSISNPSSGMGLGSPTDVNISITDNDDAILLTTLNTPSATTNFNELATSGSSTDVSKGAYFLETGTSQNTLYVSSDGSSNSGETYSYGTGTNTDRALGSGITSGLTDVKIGFKLKNNTGASFNALIVEYYGEQWRRGVTGNAGNGGAAARDKLKFEYSTSATDLATGTWGSSSILNFNSPDFGTASTDAARNGNLPANRQLVRDTIFIPAGVASNANLWVRWVHNTLGTSGSRDGLGIDDVIFTPINFSPSMFYTDAIGDLDQLSTWWTNPDGTGANPINFSGSNQFFVVQNRATATIGSNWTISGSNSSVRIRDGVIVTIPDAYSFVGKIDSLEGTSTLILNNANTPILNGIEPNTTVVYGSVSNQDIAVPTSSNNQYGNLTFSGAGVKRIIGGFRVEGEYLFSSASVDATPSFSVVFFKKNLTVSGAINYTTNYSTYINIQAYGSNTQQLVGNGSLIKAGRLLMNVANTGGALITAGADLKTGSLSLAANTDLTLNDDLKLNTNSGASSFADNGNTISVGGDLECAGNTANYAYTGTLILNGSGTSNIRQDGSTGSGSSVKAEFNNLFVQTTGTSITQVQPTSGSATLVINGEFRIGGTSTGKFTPNGNTIQIAGDFTDSRTIDMIAPGSSTFEFNGTTAQNFATAFVGGESLFNVVISNPAGLTLTTGNMRITGAGNLNCALGDITTGSNKVILSNTASITETSANNVLGNVESTRILTNALNQFGGMGLEITALGAAPGSTVVLRSTGTSTDLGCTSTSLLRKFTVTPTVNSGLNAILTYSYLNSDLNSIAESSLALYAGTGPYSSISTAVNVATNTISATGLNSLSTYVAAFASLPTVNTNSTTINASNPSRLLNVLTPDVNTNYVWSPVSDLYTDSDLTIPYVAGASATTVYAAPFSSITYNVTATNTLIACTTSPVAIFVDVDPAITNDICAANSPSGTVTVTSTPTFFVRSLTGATASPGAACVAINKDIWFSAVVPSNGEIHVTTQEHNNPTASLNITSALVQIFTATTCSTGLSQVACNNGGAAANMAYAAATGLIPGSTVYIRLARTTANNAAPAQFIRMAVTKGLIWTGATNNDFTNPANYLGGDATSLTAPSSSSTVVIPAVSSNTYPIVVGTQTCHGLEFVSTFSNQNPNITISSGAELRLQASATYKSFINRSGFTVAPKINGTGTLRFNEGGLNTGELLCPVRFYGVVAVRNGVTVTSNGIMRFENNAVLLIGGVATAVPSQNYNGTVSGNIVYVRNGANYVGYNYWSSPVTSANTDVLLSSYANNIYQYNNQNPGSTSNTLLGWTAITIGTTPPVGAGITMTPGKGYIQTFAGNGTVTFTGAPNQIPVSISTTVNGINNFNLLGNPYPAALSYDAFKAGNPTLGSVYLWSNVGATIPYSSNSYVVMSSLGLAGNSVSGFTAKEIGPAQGFLTNVSSAGNINFSPNHVVPNYPGNTTQFLEESPLSIIRLRLSNPNQISFDALVGFGETGTEGVDFGYDSPRMPSSEILEVFTLNNEQQFTTQFLPNLQTARVVNLGTVMSEPGVHTFELNQFDNFDASVRVYLEDALTGEFHNMNASSSYSFTNDPSFTDTRFRLHFMAPFAFNATGSCSNDNTGKVIISNPNENYPMSAKIKNLSGEVVAENDSIMTEYIFTSLTPGAYSLEASYDGQDMISNSVNIDAFQAFENINLTSSSNVVSIDQAIVEFSASENVNAVYTWNFGDGTILTGNSSATHAFMQPGIYTVTLSIDNSGCVFTTSTEIVVTDVILGMSELANSNEIISFPNPANEQLNIFKSSSESASFELTDVSGKVVLTVELNNKLNNINTSQFAPGVYTGTMTQNDSRKTIRIVIAH